ncbi:MAG: helix-turn-helix domain-containing protein [Planctomycetaceae bacterium]|nr:helix-turn-helix domain-containing protein [Planctomycetaceae bacterium]
MSPREIEELADAIAQRLNGRVEIGDPVGDVHDAARWLGVSVPSVERAVRAGLIPSFKVGRLRRFRKSEVLAAGRDGVSHEG